MRDREDRVPSLRVGLGHEGWASDHAASEAKGLGGHLLACRGPDAVDAGSCAAHAGPMSRGGWRVRRSYASSSSPALCPDLVLKLDGVAAGRKLLWVADAYGCGVVISRADVEVLCASMDFLHKSLTR